MVIELRIGSAAGLDVELAATAAAKDVRDEIHGQFAKQGDAASLVNSAVGGLNGSNSKQILSMLT